MASIRGARKFVYFDGFEPQSHLLHSLERLKSPKMLPTSFSISNSKFIQSLVYSFIISKVVIVLLFAVDVTDPAKAQ